MASELALQIARRNKETAETVGALRLANDVDAKLAEVREVIELAAQPKFTTVDGRVVYYLTKSDVEAARTIYDKLKLS